MLADYQQQRSHFDTTAAPSNMSSYASQGQAGPQFNNPWGAATSGASYSAMQQGYDPISKRPQTTMTMPYSSLPATAPSLSAAYSHPEMLHSTSQPYEAQYSSSVTAPSQYATTSYGGLSYGQSLAQQQEQQAHRPLASTSHLPQPTSAYSDALDGARGMVAMSQNDITPRNIYGRDRTAEQGYGFPAAHSSHSSISSASGYNGYYGSMDSSATDYSSASESMDGLNSRTLPRPNGLLAHAMPPAPQSMMGSFNSKVSSSSQKKHKCKICDKRFTRPSSLQTHMYSHTGEKPFACEVPGCGRQFSVVSNLRRHKKVHKGDRHGSHEASSHGSPEGSWATASNHE